MDSAPPLTFSITEIYHCLLAAYGHQSWWPARTPFEVMVGAVLTQSTSWSNVEKAISKLDSVGALSAAALRRLPEDELAQLIRSSGYYNAKAVKLKALAEWLGQNCADDISKLSRFETADLRQRLLGIHGVGPETADSILLYACNRSVFVIDAYTRRIADRLGLKAASVSYYDYQLLFTSALPPDVTMFNEYHALLVRLGKENCRKRPKCCGCPLKDACPSYNKLA